MLQALPQSAAQLQCSGDRCPGAGFSAEPRLFGSWLVGIWLGTSCAAGESGGGSASAQPLGLSGTRAASSGRASGSPSLQGCLVGQQHRVMRAGQLQPDLQLQLAQGCLRELAEGWQVMADSHRLLASHPARLHERPRLGRQAGCWVPLARCGLAARHAMLPLPALLPRPAAQLCPGQRHACQDHGPRTISCTAHVMHRSPVSESCIQHAQLCTGSTCGQTGKHAKGCTWAPKAVPSRHTRCSSSASTTSCPGCSA